MDGCCLYLMILFSLFKNNLIVSPQSTPRRRQLVRIQDENGMLHEARQISISMSDPVLNEETIDKVRGMASCRVDEHLAGRKRFPLLTPRALGHH